MKRIAVGLALYTSVVLTQQARADTVSTADRSALQAAMAQHIDRQAINGMFLHVDFKDGRVGRLSPAKAHPMILRMSENFVLCTDFLDQQGRSVNVDFYVARRGKAFVIFHTEVDNRAPLDKLMKDGKVVMAN